MEPDNIQTESKPRKKKPNLTPAAIILILVAVLAVAIVSTSFFVVDETE